MRNAKLILAITTIITMTGCAEKGEYEQAILAQMQKDKDIKDYNIAPEKMVECVVVTSSKDMPGMIPVDPQRRQAYINYTKMLKLNESEDPKKTLEDLRNAFGSPKALAEAHANYAESVVECMSGLVTGEEEGLKIGDKKQ
ncbi:hypothetical protein NP590_10175 [Methylomonas sp. SURF-2]|uniref:Lipoprotein n=1 Tax=Methylomonas subterranea TaxID=2952225 RepID=A0ABT1TGM5_9GAMM|nr:hypothetical protein [Methylomonas sp. SURF-2]MCQ8104469.1 hypothetical protein [Methylomonas sp. SURF-2]